MKTAKHFWLITFEQTPKGFNSYRSKESKAVEGTEKS